jgi:two-component system, LuxR family, sensor kinase FixL
MAPMSDESPFKASPPPPPRDMDDMDMHEDPKRSAGSAPDVAAAHRKIADTAMADAETWLRRDALTHTIPQTMADAILVLGEEGKVVLFNAKCERMFEYQASEIIGKTPDMLLPESTTDRHARIEDNPDVWNIGDDLILNGRSKTGLEFKVSVQLGPVVMQGRVYTIVIIRRVRE